jgi:hypothetical protein
MPSKRELEKKGPTELVVLCQGVADNPAVYTTIGSEQAFELKLKWVSLQTGPNRDPKKQKAIEAARKTLNKRMAEFLADIL